ncbi:MBL fold metallo-hydrolase [Streptomyces sp. WAC 05977]|uniref:Ribonuclease BN (tRNA processing enzyme) n=1 Tax=Amycolatopsis roodepoortensis TaxID=700274 RepID=A0ABR9L5S9_9PSEU|nr:MBL fold metallo-hydrolase [Amycolatopsis roodepoortensis]MBE1575717.1 ribonuclease BN (tRNA processing enzyme) [Amycolatopsis roodepoortensis]RSN20063.1 MBL fold metallo-hydrolase [Streptomyces sp. WAC 05977]
MRLTILGCSGSIPGPNAAASGYLIEADGFVLGLELGNGTLARLQALRDPFDLDALILSHLHPDHCADVSALTVLRRYHPALPYPARPRRLPVYGPSDVRERLTYAYAANEDERATTDLTDVFAFETLRCEPMKIGPFEVTAVPVDHPTPAFGLRFAHGGKTLAYTGDTGVCDNLTDLAGGADVLLSEASWTDSPDRPAGVHLSGKEAGELGRKAGVGRLLLTHVAPWTDRDAVLAEAAVAFPAAELVEQGAVYDL